MDMEFLTCRKATADDLATLNKLEFRALTELNQGCYPQELIEQAAEEMQMITPSLIDEGHFFVLVDRNGLIVACGGWSESPPSYDKGDGSLDRSSALVRSVFVEPHMARQGLGRWLMQLIEKDAHTHGKSKLVLTATRMGVPLYLNFGFVKHSDRPLKLSDGQIIFAVDMKKDIQVSSLPPGIVEYAA